MLSKLKKLFTELTRPRAIQIEFISYETDEETSERYQNELNKRIQKIREENSQKYFCKHIPQIVNNFVKKNGYIPSYELIMTLCLKQFTKDLIDKKIDTLYEVVTDGE